jgi:hypothetical protein
VTRARATLALAFLLSVAFLGAFHANLRQHALAQRTAISFYGSSESADGSEATVGEGPARRFPMTLRGPQAARGPHALRLVFQAEEGQEIRLGLVQFEGPLQQPLRLALRLNGGTAATLHTTAGGGRDPQTIEHGATSQHDVVLPGRALCGRNEVLIQGESGDWTALSRIDVTSPAPPSASGRRAMLGGAAVLAWVVCAVTATRRPSRPTHLAAHVALLVLGCAVGLGLAEGALRLLSPRLDKVRPLLFAPGDAEEVRATANVLEDLRGHRCAEEPCTLYDCGFRLNRDGFHTHDYAREKEQGVTRVLGLGDSFMEYSGPVPHRSELFPMVEAEARRAVPARRFEFINLGFSCAGLVTERAILEGEGLRLSPDAIVWTLYVGNDLTDETDGWTPPPRPRGGPPPLDHWWGRSLLFRLVSRLAWLGASDPRLLFASCSAPAPAAPTSCGRLERSDIPYDPALGSWTDDAYRSYALTRIDMLYRRERQAVMRGLTDVFVARLAAIQARVAPLPTVFVLIPDELQVSPVELDRVLAWDPTITRNHLDLDSLTAALTERLPQAGLFLVDLTPVFRQETARGRRLYTPNDGHLSAEGSALASRRIGDALRERGVY